MPRGGKGKKGGKKGKKDKKSRGKLRKFNLDLFGILTFTRFHGAPFEMFMYAGDKKKQKSFKDAAKKKKSKKDKKKKKKPKKKVDVPKLPMFPELPPLKIERQKKRVDTFKDPILPYINTGYHEKTTRPNQDLVQAGSVRDVLCGPKYPMPPRPQPHGGVYGNPKCPACKGYGGLTKTIFGMLHKKMRKLINAEFAKAKFILEYLIEKADQAVEYYRTHIQHLIDELGPILDGMDDSEWDDHFEVRDLVAKQRELQKELERLRNELRHLRKNRDEEIQKALADKMAEVDAAERKLRELERQLKEAIETLEDWRENHDKKLQDAADEIARQLAILQAIKDSVLNERDYLRDLLDWETKIATEQTIKEMERIISEDINHVLNWMHEAWYYVVLENRKLKEEDNVLNAENHLLELEVETLKRQLNQLEGQKKRFDQTKTFGLRPPHAQGIAERYLKGQAEIQLYEYPTTEFIHE